MRKATKISIMGLGSYVCVFMAGVNFDGGGAMGVLALITGALFCVAVALLEVAFPEVRR